MAINTSSYTTLTTSVLIGDVTNTPVQGSDPVLTMANGSPVSAALELQSTAGALLLPRLTTAQMNALNPTNGMIIYNSDTNKTTTYENGAWGNVDGGGAPTTATYILKSANAALPNAQSLGALTTGVMINTVAAGIGTVSATSHLFDGGAGANFFLGTNSGAINGGVHNLGVGYNALNAVNGGNANTGVGYGVLAATDVGPNNSAFGYLALNANTSGADNCAFGYLSLTGNLAGGDNCAFGFGALQDNTSGNYNCAFGHQALNVATTVSGQSAFGYQALTDSTTGTNNCAFGWQALAANTTGNNGCAFGYQALNNNLGGIDNTAMGYQAMLNNQTGGGGVAFGYQALAANTTQNDNCAIGFQALSIATGAVGTVAVGSGAANSQLAYVDCTFVGNDADANANNLSNATAIGSGATVSVSNALVLGSGANVGIGTSSPANALHMVGTFQQKGITSGWTGTDIIQGQTNLQTTDNTLTTILTVPIPTANDTSVTVTATVSAIQSDGSHAGYSTPSTATAFYNGTTSASAGTLPTISTAFTAGLAIAAAWSVSGNNLLLRVTGVAATNINWVCKYEYFAVSTSIV